MARLLATWLVFAVICIAWPALVEASSAFDAQTLPDDFKLEDHMLAYPPRAMPQRSCACRVDITKNVVLQSRCPSPWDHPAKTSLVPPALDMVQGKLVDAGSGTPAELHGINWFGWETESFNFDGLWAYDDRETAANTTIAPSDLQAIGANFWEKRTMTNDFAHVVHRIKALGFNAVRLPFNFTNLQRDLPRPRGDGTEFYTCMRDPVDYINGQKTLDPALAGAFLNSHEAAAAAPRYTGMAHPPPRARGADAASCNKPWDAPFLANYTAAPQYGDTLRLTMCNWYLPQGEAVQAVHRFLWQVQYLVSQGFYVVLAHTSYLTRDPNMADPDMLAGNWLSLWRMLTDVPGYKERLRGRVFADLVNEPSRWGCQWERECVDATGTLTCAPGAELYHRTTMAIHTWDPDVPVFANAMGQSHVDPQRFPTCSKPFNGMSYGDGTITDGSIIHETGISDPSGLFKFLPASSIGKLVLSPHVYPGTLTGLGQESQEPGALFRRLDLSFGLKMQGVDLTSDRLPMGRIGAVLGEFGVKDHGLPTDVDAAGDFTRIAEVDAKFLADLAAYIKGLGARSGGPVSWFWWSWNSNSQDTKGLVGPNDTWRDIQWTKVRLLAQLYGLRPWYCALPGAAAVCEGAPDHALLTPQGRTAAIATGRRRELLAAAAAASDSS